MTGPPGRDAARAARQEPVDRPRPANDLGHQVGTAPLAEQNDLADQQDQAGQIDSSGSVTQTKTSGVTIANTGMMGDLTVVVAAERLRTELFPFGPNVNMRGLPINQVSDPIALEIHPAIDAGAGTAELPVLPPYIRRSHDLQLRSSVDQATAGHTVMLVLVGDSSTGKTRAWWEAIRALPEDWRLWHPIYPGRPEALAAALEGAIEARTVLWLNDIQHYLLTPGSSLGEQVAAGLRELLRAPEQGPVLIAGTIWPRYKQKLTAPPRDGEPDLHAQARELLTGRVIPIPDTFTRTELDAVRGVATGDPRLAEALARAEDRQITQYLAGGPLLIELYSSAPSAAKALITAAMDARRLGHGMSLPRALLEDAGVGYMTSQQYDDLDDDWFDTALDYSTQRCHGARGPLTPIRPRPGVPTSGKDRYRLADYLEQHGLRTRIDELLPASLWDALVTHTTDRSDLLRIARAAHSRLLYGYAEPLYRRAMEAGDDASRSNLYELLTDQWRVDELRQFAANGDLDAHRALVGALRASGSLDAAVLACRQAIAAGCTDMLMTLADLYEQQGNLEDLLTTLQKAMAAGDSNARLRLIHRLVEDARPDEALALASADADPEMCWWLVRQLLDSPHREQAFTLIRSLVAEAALPDVIDSIWLLDRLAACGREDVIELLAGAGYDPARGQLALLRAKRADVAELNRLVAGGDKAARQRRVQLLAERRDEAALQALTADGDRDAAWELPRRKPDAGLAAGRLGRSGRVRISSYFRTL